MRVFVFDEKIGIDVWKEERYIEAKKIKKFWEKMGIEKVIL